MHAEGRKTAARTSSQQIAGLVDADSRSGFSERVADSVCRVLDVRCGKPAREAIFWNLSITKSVGLGEVASGPKEFIESLTAIYGDMAAVFEEAMVEDLRKEFGLEREVRLERESLARVLERAENASPRLAPSS
jgi:hypothetical protein